jgi:hypothetical protein
MEERKSVKRYTLNVWEVTEERKIVNRYTLNVKRLGGSGGGIVSLTSWFEQPDR